MVHSVRYIGGQVKYCGEESPLGEFWGTGCDKKVGNRHSWENNVKKRIGSEFHSWVQIRLDRLVQWFSIFFKISTRIYFVTHHFLLTFTEKLQNIVLYLLYALLTFTSYWQYSCLTSSHSPLLSLCVQGCLLCPFDISPWFLKYFFNVWHDSIDQACISLFLGQPHYRLHSLFFFFFFSGQCFLENKIEQ